MRTILDPPPTPQAPSSYKINEPPRNFSKNQPRTFLKSFKFTSFMAITEQQIKKVLDPLKDCKSWDDVPQWTKDAVKGWITNGELQEHAEIYHRMLLFFCKDNALRFGRIMLGEHVKSRVNNKPIPSPKFHEEVLALYQNNKRVAIAAPRGHAKSTITGLFYVMQQIMFGHKKFVVIVSSTEGVATRFLRRIKGELETNPVIKGLFGDMKTTKWGEGEIHLANGASVFAVGQGSQIRGLIDGANRPDLIVLDDLEDDELVRSEQRRADLSEWLNASVLPTVDPEMGQIIYIGTILHEDSLLNNFVTHKLYPEFVTKIYATYNEDTNEYLWPERFSPEDITQVKDNYIKRGQLYKFYLEYMNDPMPAESASFKNEYFNGNEFDDSSFPEDTICECFVDLGGGGVSKTADDSAFVIINTDVHNTMYINDYVAEVMDTKEMTDTLFQLYEKYHPRMFYIEKTMATNILMPTLETEMKKRNVHLNTELVTPPRGSGDRRGNMSDGKYQRIEAMAPAFKLGTIKIRPWMSKLKSQLLRFPRGKHDDLIDALAYGYMFRARRMKVYNDIGNDEDYSYEPLYGELGI